VRAGSRNAMTRRYLSYNTNVPRRISPGRVLMHNHVKHTINMPHGLNGFRAWTDDKPPKGFIKCPCGWSGLPHYAERGHVKGTKGKCVMWAQVLPLAEQRRFENEIAQGIAGKVSA
jgi:hypothetical protein